MVVGRFVIVHKIMSAINRSSDCCTVINPDAEGNITNNSSINGVKYQALSINDNSGGGGGPLNHSMNVLLVYRLNEMRHMENVNFMLAIACLSYCGINFALIVINYVNAHEEEPPVPEKW